jgi:hypothetical protein
MSMQVNQEKWSFRRCCPNCIYLDTVYFLLRTCHQCYPRWSQVKIQDVEAAQRAKDIRNLTTDGVAEDNTKNPFIAVPIMYVSTVHVV